MLSCVGRPELRHIYRMGQLTTGDRCGREADYSGAVGNKSEGLTNRQDKSTGILKVGDVAFHRSQALGSCWCRCLGAVCVLVSTVRWNRRNEAKAGTPSESCATNRVGSFRRNRALREM